MTEELTQTRALPLHIDTALTYDDYRAYAWFSMFQKGRRAKWLLILLPLILLIAALELFLPADFRGAAAFVYIAFVLLFIPAFYLAIRLSIRYNFQSSKAVFESLQRFDFTETGVQVEIIGVQSRGSARYPYAAIDKVYETKKAFYLYIGKDAAHILPKRDIPFGTENLAYFLSACLGKKYIKR